MSANAASTPATATEKDIMAGGRGLCDGLVPGLAEALAVKTGDLLRSNPLGAREREAPPVDTALRDDVAVDEVLAVAVVVGREDLDAVEEAVVASDAVAVAVGEADPFG